MRGKDPLLVEPPKPWKSLLAALLVILALALVFAWLRQFTAGDLRGNLVEESGRIDAVFCRVSGCEAAFVRELENASSASCAFYDFDLEVLADALESVGAKVIVFEENVADSPILVRGVQSEGLMHHKFCVIDLLEEDARVVTGSMNPTRNGAERNDNHLLLIESATIAKRYQAEFSELEERLTGDLKKRRVPPRFVRLNGTLTELLFCPQEKCEEAVLEEIGAAEQSIRFMTFSFTSDPIGDALLAADARGVDIKGVFEARMNPAHSEYEKLLGWGVDVRKDGNSATMHHKVFVIDNSTVITGSYNPTKSANERNDENLLIIHDKEIAAEFLSEFDRIWTRASLAAR